MTQKPCAVGMRNAILRNYLKEVATSSQLFLSTFIKFHVQIKIDDDDDDDDNDDDDDKLKQISWPHMFIFETSNKN